MFAASVPEPVPLAVPRPLADANGQHDNDSLTRPTQPDTLAVTDCYCYDDADSGANSEPVPGSVGYAYGDSPSDEPADASD